MPCHLIIARDPLIADDAARALLPANGAFERQYAVDLDIEAIFNQLCISDLFATNRAFLYVDVMDMKPGKRDTARLAEILGSLDDNVMLVCTQVIDADTKGEEERKLKSPSLKAWADHAKLNDLRSLSDGERAVGYILTRARERYGLVLTRPQATRLYEVNGERMALVDSELRKLSMLKSSEQPQPIPDSMLSALVAGSPQAHFYELADSVLRAAPDVMAKLEEWFAIESETHRLLNELRRRFLGMRTLSHGGKVQPPYFERQLRNFMGNWSGEKLDRALVLTAQFEYALKSGGTTGESSKDAEHSALQLYIIDLQETARPRRG